MGGPAVRARLLLLVLVRMSAGARAQPRPAAEPPGAAEGIPLEPPPGRGGQGGLMERLRDLARSLRTCSPRKLDEDLRLHLLKNRSVTCNDGSPAGFYMRESKSSKRWLLLLEGGWYCYSKHTCEHRMKAMGTLMSSSSWPQTRRGTGILSPKPEENPYWWNANMVLLPYCSSDVWSGSTPKTERGGYAFMGSLIIEGVVNELLSEGLHKAKVLLLAGVSAGGIGVLVNVDRVEEQLRSRGHRGVQVRGLSDSGWVLERNQYKPGDCTNMLSCGPIDAVRMGYHYWGSVMPEACRQLYRGAEWKCFFGAKIYPTIKSPTFVAQWLFDQAQMLLFNVNASGRVLTEGQRNYVHGVGQQTKSTLQLAQGAFAPACLAHEFITRTSWMDILVGGTSLPKALHCWERSLKEESRSSSNQTRRRAPPARGCPPLRLVDRCLWPNCNPTCPGDPDQQRDQGDPVAESHGPGRAGRA